MSTTAENDICLGLVYIFSSTPIEQCLGAQTSFYRYTREDDWQSLFHWVRCSLEWVEKQLPEARKETSPDTGNTAEYLCFNTP